MKPVRVGPYEIESPLGEGAMGAIHRARHIETGEPAAVKTVHVAVRHNLQGLRREIRALRAIEHPNVVRILDGDIAAAPPWYAMELIEGASLKARLDADDSSDRWKRFAPAIADVCDGLAHIHGLGLVHRDLKPGNIVLRESRDGGPGEAVLVDFGLATVAGAGIGREQLYKRSDVVGTPHYISPEQVSQDHVEPRTDLYALGCILYELIAGHPPFPADVPYVGMLRHVNDDPEFPDGVIERTPPELVELTLALLEKHPWQRPGYAEDVRAVLASLVDIGDRTRKPRPRTYLHRPEFFGRDEMRPRFDQLAREFAERTGNFIVVHGAAGAGKSRAAIELIRRFHVVVDEPIEVLLSESPQSTTLALLGSLRRAFEEIADECMERGERHTADILGPQSGLLARHLPTLASVPGVPGTTLPDEEPALVEQATVNAVTGIFERIADGRPLVLAMDDVQWADPLTRRWLWSVMEERPWERSRIAFVLVVRDGCDEALDEALTKVEGARVFDVTPLSANEVSWMVRGMTATSDLPDDFLASLMAQSRGLPARVARWLSAAVARGDLVRVGGTWTFESPSLRDTIPMAVPVEDLLRHRIDALPAPRRAVLELAAVLGPELRPELLDELGSAEVDAVDELVADDILAEAGGGAVRFAGSELYEVILSSLDEEERRQHHVRAAALLEAIDAPTIEVAHHLAASGWRDEARKRLWTGAEASFERGDWFEAERLLARLIEIGFLEPAEAVVGHARLAVMNLRRGEPDAAAAELDRARALAADVDSRAAEAELARCEGIAARMVGNATTAITAFERARVGFRAVERHADERRALLDIANCLCRQGEFARGRAVFTEVHDAARAADDEITAADALAAIGTTYISTRRYDAAIDFLSRARAALSSVERPHKRGDVTFNIGVCHADRGDDDAAAAAFAEALRLRTESGDARGAASAQAALGHVLLGIGRVDKAIEQLESAIDQLRRVRDLQQLAVAHGYLGEAYGTQRRVAEAMAQFDEAFRLHGQLPYSELAPHVHLEVAKLHRRCGEYEAARRQIELGDQVVVDDDYYRVSRTIERGRIDLASSGSTPVDLDEAWALLDEMQLSPESPLASDLRSFEAALAAPPQRRVHGELRDELPAAFL